MLDKLFESGLKSTEFTIDTLEKHVVEENPTTKEAKEFADGVKVAGTAVAGTGITYTACGFAPLVITGTTGAVIASASIAIPLALLGGTCCAFYKALTLLD